LRDISASWLRFRRNAFHALANDRILLKHFSYLLLRLLNLMVLEYQIFCWDNQI